MAANPLADAPPGGAPGTDQGVPIAPVGEAGMDKDEWAFLEPEALLEELGREYKEADSFAARDALDKAIKSPLEGTLKRYQKELDALLLYAGLFSAVLTAFNIESYRLLQPDATESNAAAIRELAAELRILASGNQSQSTRIDPLLRAEGGTAFEPPIFVVWVNSLWFASLIISLSSATLALLVKQWLYESQTGFSDQAQASTELLQFRMESLKKWHVAFWALLVPFLLQLALLVFLAGLLILLWNLNTAVAAVSTAFTGVLVVFIMVVTLLPTFYWDCCYRSPQARFTYAFLRPIRNFVWSLGRLGARTMSEYTSTNYLGIWARALQYPFVILSLGKTYVPWRVQEQDHLRRLSDELDVKIAMTAWYTTLDPVYLDHMRIAFCGEPDAPLADCLSGLVSEAHDDIDWPALLSKRNAGRRLTRMVLIALRQMLTIQRADRDRFRPPWENTVQQLINLYKNAASLWGGDRIPHDEATLRTAFFVLMEANSGSNRYAALEFLSSAVNVDSSPSCDYLTVSRVLSAAGQWIKRTPVEGGGDEEDEELQAEHSPPEINMTAFCVVVHCMLRIIEGKTNMPPPLPAVRFERLCQRASEALSQLPSFLPMGQALLAGPRGNKSLCNKLAFGLQMLLPLLTRLSRCTKTKPDDLDVPELICVEVITALWNVWETARTVLDPNMNPEPLAAAQGITQKLEVVEASVAVLFQPSYNSLLAPLRDY